MFRLKTIRRRLLVCAVYLCVTAVLCLFVAQARLVRRAALAQLQKRLGVTLGLLIDAGDFDYNFFLSRFTLNNIVLKGSALRDMPAPVRVRRLEISIPFLKLIRGRFDEAQIRADGVSVQWIARMDGRTNWPELSVGGGSGHLRPPAFLVTAGEFYAQDGRNGIAVDLPLQRVSGNWDALARRYRIICDSGAGLLRWNAALVPLDTLQLRAAIEGSVFTIESLRVTSAESNAYIKGSISGSPARIAASADLSVDVRGVSRVLTASGPARGRFQARLTASGPIQSLALESKLESEGVVIEGVPIRRSAVEALFDVGSGEVRIQRLSVGAFGGQISASGAIWTNSARGNSRMTARFDGVDFKQAARIFRWEDAPPQRTTVEVIASWRGLQWQLASVSGTARTPVGTLNFAATGTQSAVHTSFDALLAGDAAVHGNLAIGIANGKLYGTVRGGVDSLARLGKAWNLPPIDGQVRWTATVAGTTARPQASLQLAVNELAAGGCTGAQLELNARYAPHHISIDRARVSWAGQQLAATGDVGGTSSDSPLALEGTVESSSVAEAFRHLDRTPVVEGAASGRFRLSGTIAHPQAEAAIGSGPLRIYGERFSAASLAARWQDGELNLDRLVLDQAQESGTAGRFEASGRINIESGHMLFEAGGRNLRPDGVILPGGLPLAGVFELEAHGNGTLNEPVFRAKLDGSDLKTGDATIGEVHANLDAAGRQAAVRFAFPSLNAKVSSTVTTEGTWPFEVKLDSQNTHLPLANENSFDAAIHGSGTLAPARLENATATLQSTRFTVAGHDVRGDGPVVLGYSEGRIQVRHLALKSDGSSLRLSGEMPIEEGGVAGSLAIQGTLDLHPLSEFLPGGAEIGGSAEVNAAIQGNAQNWQPAGAISIHGGSFHGLAAAIPIDQVNGKVTIEGGVIRVEQMTAKAGGGALRVGGSMPLHLLADALPPPGRNPTEPARFSAEMEKFELSAGTGEHAVTATFGGRLEGEASALMLPAVRATLELTQLEAASGDNRLEQIVPTRLSIAGGSARLEQLDFGGNNVSLKAAGTMGLSGSFPLQFAITGKTDLAFLSTFAAPLETAGMAEVDVRVGGTLYDPKTTGHIELDRASLTLPNPPLQAGDIRLRAELEDDHVTLKELSGSLNAGMFTGGGDLKLGPAGLRDVKLFLRAKDVFSSYPYSIKTVSSLDVKFVSEGGRLVLRGAIDVQEGYYESALDLFSGSRATLDLGQGGPQASGANAVALDLGIVTKRPAEMDNNLGRIAATADLRLTGTVAAAGLLGALRLEEDGRLYFGDRTYYIESGTVRFQDDSHVKPVLDIQAYTRTGDYTIRLGLAGTPDELTTTFTSDPPLSRDDVIAVLLTGKTVAENRGVDLRALEATSLATGALNASLSSQLHRAVGISRVSIQPGAVAAESNPGARITLTQDFTDSLRLLYSMNLSDSNDQIWVGEYDLSRRFTTRAVKQSDNSYRGEFRHDIRFGSSSTAATRAVKSTVRIISGVHFTGTDTIRTDSLAKAFKIKPGQKYKSIKVRKGAERLNRFLMKQGYLESRVRIDRDDDSRSMKLTVRIELGPPVQLAYEGAKLSKGQRSRVRDVWHAGISDQQRPQAARESILGHFATKGFLRARTDVAIANEGGRKTVRFLLAPGPRYKNVKTVVEGASPVRTKEIEALLRERPMKQAVHRNPGVVVEAITRYYQQHGFLAAKVSPPVERLDSQRRTGSVVISVEEGVLFHVGQLQFAGNRALSDEKLCAGLPLSAGGVFEPSRVEPAVAAVKQKYGQIGYRDIKVEFALARNDEFASVDVAFTLVENRPTSVGAITVEGNRHTSVRFARRQLRLEEGEVANTELIRQSVKNLSQTGAYSAADIHVRPAAQSGADDKPVQVADLVVAVSEPKPFRLLYGGLYDSGSGPGFIADFQNHNLIGSGRVLGLRTRYDSETNEARIYATQPTWRTKPLSTTLAVYFTHSTEYLQTKPTDKLGVSIQQDLQLRSKWTLSYGYRYEKQRGFVPDPAAPNIPVDVVAVAPLSLTLSRDSRDSFLDATHGSFISHGFELAPRALGSNYPYVRYYVQYFKYFPLTRPARVPFGEKEKRSRFIFATGSRLGVQKGFNAEGAVLTDRFYAGGGTTVRGFRQDELGPKLAGGQPAGGNAVLVLNEELRYPLFWIFDAATFIDIGNVFPRVNDFRLSELRSAGGFGLRIRNPFVVLRFDYGFKFGRRPGESIGAFFFSIGQAF